jgi:hypothetical protein
VGKKKRARQLALWDEARKMAFNAAQTLIRHGCWDKDSDISEMHNQIYLMIGGKPSSPKRRPR